MATELPKLMTVEGVATYLGVGKCYIYRLTSERRIGFVKVGRQCGCGACCRPQAHGPSPLGA